MRDFEEIRPSVQLICNTAAKALARFHKLTDYSPYTMHESFLASYVFDRLGAKISMMPEVMISTLWEWYHSGTDSPPPLFPSGVRRQSRIDLVLFAPQTAQKCEQYIWGLVEFKRNWGVSRDIEKVKALLPLFGYPFGVVCGIVEPERYPGWLDQERADMEAKAEHFIFSPPWEAKIAGKRRSFVIFAHLFAAS
jgi:hypothetical protein